MNDKARKIVKVFAVFSVLFVGIAIGNDCFAGSRFVNNYQACLNASGGRGGIQAIKQACEWAAGKDNPAGENGCSLWIGSVSDSVNPEIPVYGETGVIDIMFWGTCTDRSDTTSQIKVEGDNGSIVTAGKSLTRTVMPAVSGTKTQLDVAKFIAGATKTPGECEDRYTRHVKVWRWHSDGLSSAPQDYDITLKVIKKECGPEKNRCEDFCTVTPGKTSIVLVGRNERFRDNGFKTWIHEKEGNNPIYARPEDSIEWMSCYCPGVQTEAMKDVSHVNGQYIGGTLEELSTEECANPGPKIQYEKLHNAYKTTGHGEWQNQFELGYGFNSGFNGTHTFKIGDSTRQEVKDEHWVGKAVSNDVGEELVQNATTGEPIIASISSETPSKNAKFECSCGYCDDAEPGDDCEEDYTCACCTNFYSGDHGGAIINADVTDGPDTDQVRVKVPYNFENSTEVELGGGSFVYSGAMGVVKVVKVTANVGERQNQVVNDTYATIVPESKIRLFMYVSSYDQSGESSMIEGSGEGCDVLENKQCKRIMREDNFGELNSSGNLNGDTKVWDEVSGKSYNAFDASAGDYLCLASALWPYSVNGDIDMTGGDGQWIYSTPKCKIIAKRPTFQVWGGSLYSVGSITAEYNKKVNIYYNYINNYNSDNSKFKLTSGSNIYFTPWVEQSLILRDGTTEAVASGAATGLSNSVAGVGIKNLELCKGQAALSFANYSSAVTGPCNPANKVGKSGIDSGIKDREELIKYWVGDTSTDNTPANLTLNLNNPDAVGKAKESASGEKIRYAYSKGDLNLKGDNIPKKTTYLIKSDGTVTIKSDLKYNDTNISFAQIPKLIIYAKNVNIECGVGEVDAIIITKTGGGVVNTCSNAPANVSAKERSNRLKIFGMVITDKIELERTYGSAANGWNCGGGHNSCKDPEGIIPSDGAAAEVFDFDSSILMWSELMAGSNESDTLQTVYQHELAPRY